MSDPKTNTSEPLAPAIRRGRLDKLSIFEVSESELETLERGSPDSVFLNLAISALSVAITSTASLANTTTTSDRTFCVFVIVTVVCYIAGITFALLWYCSHKSIKSVIKQIRDRLPAEGVQAPTDGDKQT